MALDKFDALKGEITRLNDEVTKAGTVAAFREEFVSGFKAIVAAVQATRKELNEKIDTRLAQVRDGKDGAKGDKGDRGPQGPMGKTFIALRGEKGDAGAPGADGSPDTPEEVRDKLETLEGEDRLDASAIKNLPELVAAQANPVGTMHSSLWSLQDVDVAGLATNQSLKWDGIKWVPYTPSGGTGGTVDSVNGQTGDVVLTASDVGADADGAAATAETNAEAYTDTQIAALNYQDPITLTTTGTSGAATFDGTTLNIPQYAGGSGGSSAWGDITGTLSDQTDLQTALDGKADSLTADQNYVSDAQLVVIGNTSGTNTGDQASIVGITGTKAQFDTAVTDGNFLYSGDITQYTDELAQDAVGTILVDSTEIDFTYNDATPSITAALKAGSIDETKLDTSVNASLDLADSSVQPADLATVATSGDYTDLINQPAIPAALSDLTGTLDDIADGTIYVKSENNYDDAAVAKLAGIASGATANSTDATLLDRANHTGTQTASTISDFDTEVANNTAVAANTAKISFDSTSSTKLAGIETAADVTDAGNVGSSIHGATGKTTPVDADELALIDSAASNVLKKLTWTNLKATLKTYFDTLYQAAGSYLTTSAIGSTVQAYDADLTTWAGKTAPSGTVLGTTDSQTTSGKRNQPRTASSTTASTLTPDLSSANVYYRTTQTGALTINAPTGTPVIGETIAIYVDAAGAQTLTVDTAYKVFGAAFPASLTAGKTFMLVGQFNGTDWKSTWNNAV